MNAEPECAMRLDDFYSIGIPLVFLIFAIVAMTTFQRGKMSRAFKNAEEGMDLFREGLDIAEQTLKISKQCLELQEEMVILLREIAGKSTQITAKPSTRS
jgi:hypothetical protein